MSQTIGIGGVNFSWPGDLDHAARLDFIHAELQVKVVPYPDISWFSTHHFFSQRDARIHAARCPSHCPWPGTGTSLQRPRLSYAQRQEWRRYHEAEDLYDEEAMPTEPVADVVMRELGLIRRQAQEIHVAAADKQVRAISDMIFENKEKMTTMEFKEQMEFIGKTREAVMALSFFRHPKDSDCRWKLEDVPNILKSLEDAVTKNQNLANLARAFNLKNKQQQLEKELEAEKWLKTFKKMDENQKSLLKHIKILASENKSLKSTDFLCVPAPWLVSEAAWTKAFAIVKPAATPLGHDGMDVWLEQDKPLE